MLGFASARGFTLFETLVATGILVTVLAGIAQLLTLGTRLTRQANASGAALVVVQDKLEELVGKPFGYAADGSAVTDAALELSAETTLDQDEPPYVDWIDAQGGEIAAPDGAVFARRWRVSSLGDGVPDAIAIEVCAFRMPPGNAPALSADACLSTVRARQP